MARRIVQTLAGRSRRSTPWKYQSRAQFHGPAIIVSSNAATPSVPTTLTLYDCLVKEAIQKTCKPKNTDPCFLQYNNLDLILIDHGLILVVLERCVMTLANGMRVAMESNQAIEMATVGVWIDGRGRFESDDMNG
jgi:hypothetical protein